MSKLERDSVYRPGASFFKEGGTLMFQFQSDSGTVIGPRPAKDSDKHQHEDAWQLYKVGAFNEAPLEAFDHDGNGEPGGIATPESHVSSEPVVEATPKPRGRPRKQV